MASKDAPSDIKVAFETFSKGAYLDLFLPRSNDSDVSKLLKDAPPEELARIPSRRNIFFGSSIASTLLDLLGTDMMLGQTRMLLLIWF